MVFAVLDGEGESRGRGAAAQGAGVHEKSVGSGRPVIDCAATLRQISVRLGSAAHGHPTLGLGVDAGACLRPRKWQQRAP